MDWDQYYMSVAQIAGQNSKCLSRRVGAVLVKEKSIISTGYNGSARGTLNCGMEVECLKDLYNEAHYTSYEHCPAVHAEQNALLQCKDVFEIETAYITASPCVVCTRLLLNTSCKKIVFIEKYPHLQAENAWKLSGRLWEQMRI